MVPVAKLRLATVAVLAPQVDTALLRRASMAVERSVM